MGRGTFSMPLFALDFAKFTICALLPLVNIRPMTPPKADFEYLVSMLRWQSLLQIFDSMTSEAGIVPSLEFKQAT
jgi:hypothetical protein